MAKSLFFNILTVIVFLTFSCCQDKGGLITRTWQLERVRGRMDTLNTAIPQDEYHSVLAKVINEHRKHSLCHGAITWVFNADSTFKMIFREFHIKTLSKKELMLENDELGKRPIILIFSAKKEN
jgi:hypothetical protein